ncbi:hypothetical protein BC828DRAFT_387172 [Blastocladiella britannica]|nr:hypothetical protein BC828DRAFT_387172 [Blastocladiella britannica]
MATNKTTTTTQEPPPPPPRPTLAFTQASLALTPPSQHDLYSRLPYELARAIMVMVAVTPSPRGAAAQDLCAASLVCRYWARLALDPAVWRAHYRRVIAADYWHVDGTRLHPLAAVAVAGDPDPGFVSDADLLGLVKERRQWGLVDAAAIELMDHVGRWWTDGPPSRHRHRPQSQPPSSWRPHAGTGDATWRAERRAILLHLARTTYPTHLAPHPPLTYAWLCAWKQSSAVVRADAWTRRRVITAGELVRLCFAMHHVDWAAVSHTPHGGELPVRLRPTWLASWCADGAYRSTFYRPDAPIRLSWSYVAAIPTPEQYTRDPFPGDELAGMFGVDEDDDDDDEMELDQENVAVCVPGAARTTRPPQLPHTAQSVARTRRHSISLTSPPLLSLSLLSSGSDGGSGSPPLASPLPLLPITPYQRYLSNTILLPSAIKARDPDHHRHRVSFLTVDEYFPFTVSRVPEMGQWILINRYYLMESTREPVGPATEWLRHGRSDFGTDERT